MRQSDILLIVVAPPPDCVSFSVEFFVGGIAPCPCIASMPAIPPIPLGGAAPAARGGLGGVAAAGVIGGRSNLGASYDVPYSAFDVQNSLSFKITDIDSPPSCVESQMWVPPVY